MRSGHRKDQLPSALPEAAAAGASGGGLEGRAKNIGLIDLRQVLELAGQAAPGEKWPVVVGGDEQACYGNKVDRFLGERELVVRTLDMRLGKVENLSAVSLMEDGSPVLILDVEDLQRSIQKLLSGRRLASFTACPRRPKIWALQNRSCRYPESLPPLSTMWQPPAPERERKLPLMTGDAERISPSP